MPDDYDMSPDSSAPRNATEAPVRVTSWVRGQVQGVGFRWWVRARALENRLVGSASNLRDGRVEVIAEGDREDCERLVELLSSGGTPGHVDGVVSRWSEPKGGLHTFVER